VRAPAPPALESPVGPDLQADPTVRFVRNLRP
jgi:hypothetical protein